MGHGGQRDASLKVSEDLPRHRCDLHTATGIAWRAWAVRCPQLFQAAGRALSLEVRKQRLPDHSSAGWKAGMPDLPGQAPSEIVKLLPGSVEDSLGPLALVSLVTIPALCTRCQLSNCPAAHSSFVSRQEWLYEACIK